MTEAEMMFNQTFWRFNRQWASVSGFRDTVLSGMSAAESIQGKIAAELYNSLTEDPEYRPLLHNPEEFAKNTSPEQFTEMVTTIRMKETGAALDAATLVFAHSVLDGAAIDCCRVTALHAPRDWEPDLDARTFPLAEIRAASYDALLAKKLNEHLDNLERESLPKKAERLMARCQPPPKWSPMIDYEFDGKLVTRFDNQRHMIIHGDALGKPLTEFALSKGNMYYLMRTGMYFIGLVNMKYHLQIDPGYISAHIAEKSAHTSTDNPQGCV
jgi:hypothetical protein